MTGLERIQNTQLRHWGSYQGYSRQIKYLNNDLTALVEVITYEKTNSIITQYYYKSRLIAEYNSHDIYDYTSTLYFNIKVINEQMYIEVINRIRNMQPHKKENTFDFLKVI